MDFRRQKKNLAGREGARTGSVAEQIEVRAAADPQVQAVLDGVEATDRQLLQTLERYGVKAVDTSDGKFDPNLHHAVSKQPSDNHEEETIIEEYQKGYFFKDRLLRPAMVKVAVRP